MAFVGILGDQGSGKTAYMTYWLHMAYLAGKNVAADYHLGCTNPTCIEQHPEFLHTRFTFQQIVKTPDIIMGKYVGIDELGIGGDAYEFFSKQGRGLAEVVSQRRKREAMFMYTAQRYMQINTRLRSQTDRFILCEDLDRHTPHTGDYKCRGLFKLEFMNAEFQLMRACEFNAAVIWHLYPTRQLIRA